jgi:hypothetical protein
MMGETEKRITHARMPDGTLVKCQDLDFEVESEPWARYKLKDGTMLKVKVVVGKISRAIDPKTGGILRNPETGEPYYNVLHNVFLMAEVPESLMKR